MQCAFIISLLCATIRQLSVYKLFHISKEVFHRTHTLCVCGMHGTAVSGPYIQQYSTALTQLIVPWSRRHAWFTEIHACMAEGLYLFYRLDEHKFLHPCHSLDALEAFKLKEQAV